MSFRCILGFFVFVCLCAAIYGVIKNNNLVRLSSIVPFHIIYQVNLYWRNNSAHKYNYFETLFHTLAFHTNFSRNFHPCNLVPHFHVSHFQSPHLNLMMLWWLMKGCMGQRFCNAVVWIAELASLKKRWKLVNYFILV